MKSIVFAIISLAMLQGCAGPAGSYSGYGSAGRTYIGPNGDTYYVPSSYGQQVSAQPSLKSMRQTACNIWGSTSPASWSSSNYNYACFLPSMLGL